MKECKQWRYIKSIIIVLIQKRKKIRASYRQLDRNKKKQREEGVGIKEREEKIERKKEQIRERDLER